MIGNVVVWQQYCAPCAKAKHELEKRGITFTQREFLREISLDELRASAPGVSSMPQIWLDGQHIGGHMELVKHFAALDAQSGVTSNVG